MKSYVYMDNNATTPLHPKVKEVLMSSFEDFGNASSPHSYGRKVRQQIEHARQEIADFIGSVSKDEIIFLGSGSEANNTVLNIFACVPPICSKGVCKKGGIVTTKIEHPCILEAAKCLETRGTSVFYLNVDEHCKVDLEQLGSILKNNKIGLVSVMMANNEVGTIQDIKAISSLAHKYGALVHTDAVQALGKVLLNVKDLDVDFLSLSAHKVYGPKGIGALYVRKGIPFCPLIRGGHQEKGRRAGTENSLGIIGFGKAVECLREEMEDTVKYIKKLKQKLVDGIQNMIPDIKINGFQDSTPNTLNVSFRGAEGEAILLYLDLEGIAISTGSACSSGSLDPSHVLLAMGLDAAEAHGSIRFSLGRESTEEDVDTVLSVLPDVIKKIRKMSTAY